MRIATVFLLASVLLAACAPAPSDRPPPMSQSIGKECATLGALGAVIMAGRQTGKSSGTVLREIGQAESPGVRRLIRAMVTAAYRVPIHRTAQGKKDAVRDYTLRTATICQRARRRTVNG